MTENQPVVNLIRQADEFYARRKDIYKPLDASRREIRVMHILPGELADDEIKVTLETVSLDQKPVYETISYAWEYTGDTRTIVLVNTLYHVTPNQFAALKHIRHSDELRILWMDAVCIDQANLDERSQQVRMMADIYRQGSRLYVWLAESIDPELCDLTHDERYHKRCRRSPNLDGRSHFIYPPSKYAPVELEIDLLEQADCTSKACYALDLLATASSSQPIPLAELAAHNDARGWYSSLKALRVLLTVTWWSRAWTFQEIVLALSAEVPISALMGSRQIDFAKFLQLGHFYLSNDPNSDMLTTFLPYVSQKDGLYSLGTLFIATWAYLKEGSLHYLDAFKAGQSRSATDPHDNVYAFLGLINNGAADIAVDYTLPVRQTFISATCMELKLPVMGHLFAGSVCTQPNSFDLPSWCFDWANNKLSVHDGRLWFEANYYTFSPLELSNHMDLSDAHLGRLRLTAIELASIEACTEATTDTTDSRLAHESVLGLRRRFLADHGIELLADDWRRLNFMDSHPLTTNRSERLDERSLRSISSWEACGSQCSDAECVEHAAVREAFWRRYIDTKTFVTHCGNVGIGVMGLCEGDKIFAILGDSTIYVLRPYSSDDIERNQMEHHAGVMKEDKSEMCHGHDPLRYHPAADPSQEQSASVIETYQVVGTCYVSNWRCAIDGSRSAKRIQLV